jgi:signal transduction histidine kinase
VLVAQIVDEATTAAGGVEVEVEGDLDTHAMVDPWHLRQILTNLIGNAVKYGKSPFQATIRAGHPGGPGTGRDDANGSAVSMQIEIRDSGEGVPPDFVPQLFDRFARAQTGIATKKQGTGFGLYIVRQLVHVNGGRIEYRPGLPGARFVVTLPAAASSSSSEDRVSDIQRV